MDLKQLDETLRQATKTNTRHRMQLLKDAYTGYGHHWHFSQLGAWMREYIGIEHPYVPANAGDYIILNDCLVCGEDDIGDSDFCEPCRTSLSDPGFVRDPENEDKLKTCGDFEIDIPEPCSYTGPDLYVCRVEELKKCVRVEVNQTGNEIEISFAQPYNFTQDSYCPPSVGCRICLIVQP